MWLSLLQNMSSLVFPCKVTWLDITEYVHVQNVTYDCTWCASNSNICIFAGWSRCNMAVTHYVQINLCTLRYFLVSWQINVFMFADTKWLNCCHFSTKRRSAAHRLSLLLSLIITIIFVVVSRSKSICVQAYLISVKKENSHNEVQYATHSLWWQILMFDVMSEMEALKKILAHVWIKKMEI